MSKHGLIKASLILPLLISACGEPRSCSVAQNPDGSAILSCSDGFSATITPGRSGQRGVDGQPGRDGVNGASGTNGTNGADCTLQVGTTTTIRLICPDGTTVTLNDGSDCTVASSTAGVTVTCTDGRTHTIPYPI